MQQVLQAKQSIAALLEVTEPCFPFHKFSSRFCHMYVCMYVCMYLWNGLKKVEDYLTALELIQTARRLFHKEQLFQISSMRAVGAQVEFAHGVVVKHLISRCPVQLDGFHELVCQVMCNRFVSSAIRWEASAVIRL